MPSRAISERACERHLPPGVADMERVRRAADAGEHPRRPPVQVRGRDGTSPAVPVVVMTAVGGADGDDRPRRCGTCRPGRRTRAAPPATRPPRPRRRVRSPSTRRRARPRCCRARARPRGRTRSRGLRTRGRCRSRGAGRSVRRCGRYSRIAGTGSSERGRHTRAYRSVPSAGGTRTPAWVVSQGKGVRMRIGGVPSASVRRACGAARPGRGGLGPGFGSGHGRLLPYKWIDIHPFQVIKNIPAVIRYRLAWTGRALSVIQR
ncbi:hypothetical protein M2163_005806 [Streptomyces sp. SAI-135]|nr:hypothetical protein [Streptomyces sp. SAI-090]MDH6618698.1 hypothetical protein [Streptomyces sp. SAI-135]